MLLVNFEPCAHYGQEIVCVQLHSPFPRVAQSTEFRTLRNNEQTTECGIGKPAAAKIFLAYKHPLSVQIELYGWPAADYQFIPIPGPSGPVYPYPWPSGPGYPYP